MVPIDLREDCAALRARKRAIAVTVEFADAGGTLATREGPVAYAQGDALLTGIEGERWPVPRQHFDETYEAIAPLRPGKPGPYCKRPLVVWAKPMRESFAVDFGERGTLRGKPGDWLLQYSPGDLSVVDATIFLKAYELLD